ncbi:MAG: hypothetical protein ACREQW_15080 [Candidatus Binatia bacterium]
MNLNIEDRAELMSSSMTISAIYDIQPLSVRSRLTPEEELLLAILKDAVICFQKYAFAKDQRGRELFLEAEAWIMSNANEGLFSFTGVCDHLGVAASYVRQSLLGWKKQMTAKKRRGNIAGPQKKAA